MTFGIVLFCSLSSLAFSGFVMWLLEKKAVAARRQVPPISHTFLAGSVAFSSVYFLNRIIFPRWPEATAVLNMAALSAMLFSTLLRKRLRRRRPKIVKKQRGHPEVAALERMLEQDPLNAFCHERLSEIYEQIGKDDKALAAASEAARLDPTVKNKLRVEDLKKEIKEKAARGTGWKPF